MNRTRLENIFTMLVVGLSPDKKDCIKLVRELYDEILHYKHVEDCYGNIDLANLLKLMVHGGYRIDECHVLRHIEPSNCTLTKTGLYYSSDESDEPYVLYFEDYGMIKPGGWAATEGELMR